MVALWSHGGVTQGLVVFRLILGTGFAGLVLVMEVAGLAAVVLRPLSTVLGTRRFQAMEWKCLLLENPSRISLPSAQHCFSVPMYKGIIKLPGKASC